MTENVEIKLYVPVGDQQLQDQELIWLNNFSKILQIGLTQFHQVKINVGEAIFSVDEINKSLNKNQIIIQLLLNENVDQNKVQNISGLEKINKNQIIQLYCFPVKRDIHTKAPYKTINFFDEAFNKSIKLDENIEKIKDEVWLKFLDLSLEIKRILKDLSETGHNETTLKSVFLAYTSFDQNINRKIIEREVRQLGYAIIDPSLAISDANELKDYISKNLPKSTLSLHIIGNSELPLIPDQEISIVEFQNKIFVDYVNTNKNANIFRLVWIPPDIKPKTEKQRMYIESFMHQVEAMGNTEIVQTPIEVFKSIIQRKLMKQSEVVPKDSSLLKDNKKSVYIIYNESDHERANQISVEFEKKGIEVLKSEKAHSNIENIRIHHKNLVQCDAVLIFQNEANKLWLNSKISDILKAPGIGRKKKYIFKALYSANNSAAVTGLRDLIILNNKVSISESIQPIIEIIEKYDTSR